MQTSAPGREWSSFDREAMERALFLAQQGLATTDPNPRVGCVLAQGTRIVGEGWHERAGEAHAEVMALRAAAEKSRGATAYVTLEPCAHQGRTPPCADALIAAGVKTVIYAIDDPNPRVAGGGAARLAAAGVAVAGGLMAAQAEALNPGFLKRMRWGLPWVRLKLGTSLDGRTALANGASRWITGEAAREDVQHFRARSSVLLTGIGTVLDDDPRLDVRLPGTTRQPLRVVLDSRLRTVPTARLFTRPGPVLIFGAASAGVGAAGAASVSAGAASVASAVGAASGAAVDPAAADRQAALEQRGARVEWLAADAAGRVALPAALARLAELEANEVMVEAGANLAGALLSAGLVDELLLYVAPSLLGPDARPFAALPPLTRLEERWRLHFTAVARVGEDLRLQARVLPRMGA